LGELVATLTEKNGDVFGYTPFPAGLLTIFLFAAAGLFHNFLPGWCLFSH